MKRLTLFDRLMYFPFFMRIESPTKFAQRKEARMRTKNRRRRR